MFNLVTEIKLFFIVLLVYVSLDLSMKLVLPTPYKKAYVSNLTNVNGGDNKPWPVGVKLWGYMTLGYLLVAFGTYYFCVKQNNYLNAILFGIILYGAYNSVNVATITNYEIKLAAFDTAWGTTLIVLTTLISLLLSKLLTSTVTITGTSSITNKSATAPATALETTTSVPSKNDDLGLESDD
jgi:uncharacterized membrane protein